MTEKSGYRHQTVFREASPQMAREDLDGSLGGRRTTFKEAGQMGARSPSEAHAVPRGYIGPRPRTRRASRGWLTAGSVEVWRKGSPQVHFCRQLDESGGQGHAHPSQLPVKLHHVISVPEPSPSKEQHPLGPWVTSLYSPGTRTPHDSRLVLHCTSAVLPSDLSIPGMTPISLHLWLLSPLRLQLPWLPLKCSHLTMSSNFKHILLSFHP